MPIVVGGLGLPEEGALVAGGLGVSETDPNALAAHLSGTGSVTATLTDANAPAPTGTGSPGFRTSWVIPIPPQAPKPIPGELVAHLSGTSHLAAHPDFTIDPDYLAYELAQLLLLDLV